MNIRHWLRKLLALPNGSTKRITTRRPRQMRLCLEPLEQRCVPAFTVLDTFTGANGVEPRGNLVEDSTGNLFGVTYVGGTHNDGTVFEVPTGSRKITTLASFDGTNGAYPTSGVVEDSGGNLYGITHQGGNVTEQGASAPDNVGTVFELPYNSSTLSYGSITTLFTFTYMYESTYGYFPVSQLVMDSSGNLYGTTIPVGGANGTGTVFELTAGSHSFTTLASFSATSFPGQLAGVIVDTSGNLFGTTSSNGVSKVFEIVKGSGSITTLASFDPTRNGTAPNGYNPNASLVEDNSGNLFGTTSGGGAYEAGMIFEVPAGSGTIITLGSFPYGGQGAYSNLIEDSSGDYFSTSYNYAYELVKGSGIITTLTDSLEDGANGLVEDSSGNLFGVDGGDGNDGDVFEVQVAKITPPTLPNWTVNQPGYSQTISAIAVTGGFNFSHTGTLPPGLALSSSSVVYQAQWHTG